MLVEALRDYFYVFGVQEICFKECNTNFFNKCAHCLALLPVGEFREHSYVNMCHTETCQYLSSVLKRWLKILFVKISAFGGNRTAIVIK